MPPYQDFRPFTTKSWSNLESSFTEPRWGCSVCACACIPVSWHFEILVFLDMAFVCEVIGYIFLYIVNPTPTTLVMNMSESNDVIATSSLSASTSVVANSSTGEIGKVLIYSFIHKVR